MKETLSLRRDFTRFFNDFQFPHSVRVCVGDKQMLCSGALLAQQSTVIEKVIREDNGVLMFEELLDVPNGCQGIIESLNYLHGANFDFNVETLPVILKFSCLYEIRELFDEAIKWLINYLEDQKSVQDVLSFLRVSSSLQADYCVKLEEAICQFVQLNKELFGTQFYESLDYDTSDEAIMLILRNNLDNSIEILMKWAALSMKSRNYIIKNHHCINFNEIFHSVEQFSSFIDFLSSETLSSELSKDLLCLQKSFFEQKILEDKSSNVWVNKRKRMNSILESFKRSKLHGHILSVLNKMTPQNFKELSVQMLQLKFDSMKKIDLATELIHKKAILEPAYIQTYANLCKIMGTIKLPEEQNAKVSPFRRRLLNLCQREFFQENSEKNNLDKKIKELHEKPDIAKTERRSQLAELIHQRSKLKAKMLGNVEFIGELFNLGMLSSKIITSQCISNLLAKKPITEDAIECLAKLFSTTGLKLDSDSLDDELKRRAFEKGFSDFKKLGSNPIYSNRIRFMVQDVVELREKNWVPRRVKEKPQRIEEIHRIFFEEEHQRELEAQLAKMIMIYD